MQLELHESRVNSNRQDSLDWGDGRGEVLGPLDLSPWFAYMRRLNFYHPQATTSCSQGRVVVTETASQVVGRLS